MDGKLTGNVIGDIVDAKYKANTLRKLAEKNMKFRRRKPWRLAMAPTICR